MTDTTYYDLDSPSGLTRGAFVEEHGTTLGGGIINSPSEYDDYVAISTLHNVAPQGWTMHTHPRGSIYFHNSRYHAVVDEDIRIPAILKKATEFCAEHSHLVAAFKEMESHMAFGADASLSLFVNHRHSVAAYDYNHVSDNYVRDLGVNGFLRARRLYWGFIMQHPSHHSCRSQGFDDAIDALHSFHHDHLIDGSRSIAPFSKVECEELLQVLHREREGGTDTLPSVRSLLGWILRDIYSFRLGQRYGQITWTELRSFRHTLNRPGPEFNPRETFATRLFMALIVNGPFFGIPQTYLAHIKEASDFRGHLAGLRINWERYAKQLVREYSDFILIATVLLSATVGMLTVNNVGPVAKIAAMLSAFAALGSMTVGVFFVWRHQRNTRMPSSFTYLHNARNNTFGLSGHATLLSLPPVLLVWSIIAFAVSALAYALQDVSLSTPAVSAWVFLAIFVVIFVAVMAGVYTFSTIWSWQSQESWWRSIACWPRGQDGGVT